MSIKEFELPAELTEAPACRDAKAAIRWINAADDYSISTDHIAVIATASQVKRRQASACGYATTPGPLEQ